jgi:hypothetical protein
MEVVIELHLMKKQFLSDNLQQIVKQIFQYDGLLYFLELESYENKVRNLDLKILHILNDDERGQEL